MSSALANAKINLALRVQPPRDDGYHPIWGVFQSVDWSDDVSLTDAERDGIVVDNDLAPEDESNLAWRAVAAVREAAGLEAPVEVSLQKSVPDGAGLGGGSADAAAALMLASRHFGVTFDDLRTVAFELGADVPFAVVGGTAVVGGIGELVSPLPDATGFVFGIVVPELTLESGRVYRAWDELDGPSGPEFPEASLPPVLRDLAPLANDLYPAAVSIAPQLDDLRAELERAWGMGVAMTGSGAALFAYFPTLDEAADAVRTNPIPARAAQAAAPVDHGWRLLEERPPS